MLSNVHLRALKWFMIYHAIYCLPILICVIIPNLPNIDGNSLISQFSVAYLIFSYFYAILVEPIMSGIVMQLVFKSNIVSIVILTILKAVVSVLTTTAITAINFAFDGYNRYVDSDEWLASFLIIPYTTLPFLAGTLLVYAIQRFINKFKRRG